MPFCFCFAANVDPTEGAEYAGHRFHSSNMHGNSFRLLEQRKCRCPLNLPSFPSVTTSTFYFARSPAHVQRHKHLHGWQPSQQAKPHLICQIYCLAKHKQMAPHRTYYSSSRSLRHVYCACWYRSDAKCWWFCGFKFSLLCILKTDTLLY